MAGSLVPLKLLVALKHGIVGHVDRVEGSDTLVGWAADLSAPDRPVVVECLYEGRVVALRWPTCRARI